MTAIIISATIAIILTANLLSYQADCRRFKKEIEQKKLHYYLTGKRLKNSSSKTK